MCFLWTNGKLKFLILRSFCGGVSFFDRHVLVLCISEILPFPSGFFQGIFFSCLSHGCKPASWPFLSELDYYYSGICSPFINGSLENSYVRVRCRVLFFLAVSICNPYFEFSSYVWIISCVTFLFPSAAAVCTIWAWILIFFFASGDSMKRFDSSTVNSVVFLFNSFSLPIIGKGNSWLTV